MSLNENILTEEQTALQQGIECRWRFVPSGRPSLIYDAANVLQATLIEALATHQSSDCMLTVARVREDFNQ